MTSRIGQPNTATDSALHERLASDGNRHFVMVAGAGSGKTTSLVKALAQIERTQGASLRRNGQQVACITYTEVPVAGSGRPRRRPSPSGRRSDLPGPFP